MMWRGSISLLIGWVLLAGAAPATGEQRIALVIGNAAYPAERENRNLFGPLANPKNDAEDMQKQLEAYEFRVTPVMDADEIHLREAVNTFIDELIESNDEQTVGLFYYSGHGVQVDGNNYLIPVGQDVRDKIAVQHHALNAQEILDRMASVNPRVNIMILDACRADVKLKARNTQHKGEGDLSENGFAKMTAALGSIVGYATESGKTAIGETGARNSYYTRYLLDAMRTMPHKTIESVFKETRAAVVAESKEQQVPVDDNKLMGDFCFGGCGQPTPDTSLARQLQVCAKHAQAGRLVEGLGGNAADCYAAVLQRDPGNLEAVEGLNQVAAQCVEQARQALAKRKNAEAAKYLACVRQVNPGSDEIEDLEAQLTPTPTVTPLPIVKATVTPTATATPTPEPTPTPSQEGKTWTEPVTRMEFVWIEGGTFQMGCGKSDTECSDDEKPAHAVTVDGFWMGKDEVTQAQWQKVMGTNPAYFNRKRIGEDTSNYPVESVSWEDAQAFLKNFRSLGDFGSLGSVTVRLPTEAEWEYGCRAGTQTAYSFDDADKLGEYAWYGANSGGQTHEVGQRKPNAWGLYDMHGNVWEWCQDWYDEKYYANSPEKNPQGPGSGQFRLLRGGSWYNQPNGVRSAYRNDNAPAYHFYDVGLRLVVVGARTLSNP